MLPAKYLCMNTHQIFALLSIFLFIYFRRLEDFPTSPTSTEKQEFLYVDNPAFKGLHSNSP